METRMTSPDVEPGPSSAVHLLPDEVLQQIFKLLSLDSLLVCERVCRRWRRLAADRALWAAQLVTHSDDPRHDQNRLSLISSHGKQISLLKVRYVEDYSRTRQILEHCPDLTSLELVKCKLERRFKVDVEKYFKLKKLDLKTSYLFDSDNIDMGFDTFSDLRWLALPGPGLSLSSCKSLLRCPSLTHIYIEKTKGLTLEFMNELISSRASVLVALHVEGGDAVDAGTLGLLGRCARLRDLALLDCRNLTDEGLLSLTRLNTLEHLKICNNSKFSEKSLLVMFNGASLVTLKTLDVSAVANVSVRVINSITESYKNIRRLTMYSCPQLAGHERQLEVILRNVVVALYY